jgi:hypothetical protein
LHEREVAEWESLRERGAAVLGPIGLLLADADPLRVAFSRPNDVEERWRGLRDELAVWGDAHSLPEIRIVARRLSTAVSNVMTSGSWMLGDGAEQGDIRRAEADHRYAGELLDALRARIWLEMDTNEFLKRVAELERSDDEEAS